MPFEKSACLPSTPGVKFPSITLQLFKWSLDDAAANSTTIGRPRKGEKDSSTL